MKSSALFAFFGLVISTTVALPAEIAERAVTGGDLVWSGVVTPGAESITLIGTAETIYNQIIAINPNYDNELGINSNVTRLEQRAPINSNSINCNIFNPASDIYITLGIEYLYRIGDGGCGAPAGRPGAGGCSRVSCSFDSAIWMVCNDAPHGVSYPCRWVADNAAGIMGRCISTVYTPPALRQAGGSWSTSVRGQIFSFDGSWNTIVRGDSC